jgi:hypothetical protein
MKIYKLNPEFWTYLQKDPIGVLKAKELSIVVMKNWEIIKPKVGLSVRLLTEK